MWTNYNYNPCQFFFFSNERKMATKLKTVVFYPKSSVLFSLVESSVAKRKILRDAIEVTSVDPAQLEGAGDAGWVPVQGRCNGEI